MIFPYSTLVVAAPDASDEYLVVYRPEIPATFSGSMGSATYLGLVDTGSDNTIVPKSIADDLGIATYETSEPAASVFGGYQVRLLAGEVVICLKAGEEEISGSSPEFVGQ